MKRRNFLVYTLAAAGAGLFQPARPGAAVEPADPFAARSEAEVIRALFGDQQAIASNAISIEAPLLATPGEPTQFKVKCDLENVELIAVVTSNNPYPLNTYVRLFDADGYYSTRIRLQQTSTVTAYVKAGGKLYSAFTHIKVNLGGYGMNFFLS